MKKTTAEFQKTLLIWYNENKRELPWRKTQDPYAIWISEIILQQTRIAQGISYYIRFLDLFPDISSLAKAPLEDVLKAWQGLGYYTRARNLHKTAKILWDTGGRFPGSYQQLLQLPGIGKYTAAAIASIAYNEPQAVCDGNVIRFLARYFSISQPVDQPAVQDQIRELACELLDREQAGTFNQALMEFGALQCTPAKPDCIQCPFKKNCLAYNKGIVEEIPQKAKEKKIRSRYFHYLILEKKEGFFLEKRSEKDIWQDLFQFPLIELDKQVKSNKLKSTDLFKNLQLTYRNALKKKGSSRHILSHQVLEISFWHIMLPEKWEPPEKFIFADRKTFQRFPVPVPIAKYLQEWHQS